MSYGTDLSATDSIHRGRLVSGPRFVGEALYRRYKTQNGRLKDDPSYGFHISSWLNRPWTPRTQAQLEGLIRMEAMKDERVESVLLSILVLQGPPSVELEITLTVVLSNSEVFELVLKASAVTVELLGIRDL